MSEDGRPSCRPGVQRREYRRGRTPERSRSLPLPRPSHAPVVRHTRTPANTTPPLLEGGLDLPRFPDPPRVPSSHHPASRHRPDALRAAGVSRVPQESPSLRPGNPPTPRPSLTPCTANTPGHKRSCLTSFMTSELEITFKTTSSCILPVLEPSPREKGPAQDLMATWWHSKAEILSE